VRLAAQIEAKAVPCRWRKDVLAGETSESVVFWGSDKDLEAEGLCAVVSVWAMPVSK